jgi:hypothetical protein
MHDEMLAEVAEAEAAGLKAEELTELRGQVEGAAAIGLGLTYDVPDRDKAAWIPAWRIGVDQAGVERGVPVKLAKQALGMYLSKKRPVDGGRLFTLKMPAHIVPLPTFKCFVVPDLCRYMADTKMNLLDHIEAAHPREATHIQRELQIIRDSALRENVILRDIIAGIAATPDPSSVEVPLTLRAEHDATVPDVPMPEAETISVTVKCDQCDWPQGSTRWAHEQPTQRALLMHIAAKHSVEE